MAASVAGSYDCGMQSPNSRSGRFRDVIDFIESRLEDEIRLADLASMAHLSPAHFARAFKAEYGTAPYQYVVDRRIERAKALLRSNEDTISLTASVVGFTTHSRFCEMFSRAVGLTPSAYRTMHRAAVRSYGC